MGKREELELRKLRAEAELAERNLRESKKEWVACDTCGGAGFTVTLDSAQRGGMHYRTVRTERACLTCCGEGGGYVYED